MLFVEKVLGEEYKHIILRREKEWAEIFSKYEQKSAHERVCDDPTSSSSGTEDDSVCSELREATYECRINQISCACLQRKNSVCKPAIVEDCSVRSCTLAKTVTPQCEELSSDRKSGNVDWCHYLSLSIFSESSRNIINPEKNKFEHKDQSLARDAPRVEAYSMGPVTVQAQQFQSMEGTPGRIITNQCEQSSEDSVKILDIKPYCYEVIYVPSSEDQIDIKSEEKGSEKFIKEESMPDQVQYSTENAGSCESSQSRSRELCLRSCNKFNMRLKNVKVPAEKLNKDVISCGSSNVVFSHSDLNLIRNSQKKSNCYIEDVQVPTERSSDSCKASYASIVISNGKIVETDETPGKQKKCDPINGGKNLKDVSVLERKFRKRSKSSVKSLKPFFTSSVLKNLEHDEHKQITQKEYNQLYSIPCNDVSRIKRKIERTTIKSFTYHQRLPSINGSCTESEKCGSINYDDSNMLNGEVKEEDSNLEKDEEALLEDLLRIRHKKNVEKVKAWLDSLSHECDENPYAESLEKHESVDSHEWKQKKKVSNHANVSDIINRSKSEATESCSSSNKSFEKNCTISSVCRNPSEKVTSCKGNGSMSNHENSLKTCSHTDRDLKKDKLEKYSVKKTRTLQPNVFRENITRTEDCTEVENKNSRLCSAFSKEAMKAEKKAGFRKRARHENNWVNYIKMKMRKL